MRSSVKMMMAPPSPRSLAGKKQQSLSYLPPPAAEDPGGSSSGLPSRRTHILSRREQSEFDAACRAAQEMEAKEEEEAMVTSSSSSPSPPSSSTSLVPANPFKGLHECLSRSYRLDEVLDKASPHDIVLAKQDVKTKVFSFLSIPSNQETFELHWQSGSSSTSSSSSGGGTSPPSPAALVASDYNVLLAHRLLQFPPEQRHFHSVCCRQDVPCDFFADVDLVNVSREDAERTLLDILDYLEVRLPGVGFTDPFFLVLANATTNSSSSAAAPAKWSYHLHARSMTHELQRSRRSTAELVSLLKLKKGRGGRSAAAAGEEKVTAVDGKKTTKKKTSGSGGATRVIAFQDYRVVKLIADEVNQTLGFPAIDEGSYRLHGSLRCAYSKKLDAGAAPLVPLAVHPSQPPALQAKLEAMHAVLDDMSEAEVLAMSFCSRHLPDSMPTLRAIYNHLQNLASFSGVRVPNALFKAATPHRFRLIHPTTVVKGSCLGLASEMMPGTGAKEYDAYGNRVSPYLTEGAKWRRYHSVLRKLEDLPPRAAGTYSTWVRTGLALHNFSNEEHVFEEWVKFSLRCPQKYSREACQKKWRQFERNPDALNWRRGFNYLNQTIWREV